MESTNRFAPPGAQVEDVVTQGSGFQPVRLWPPRGRIGRLRFLSYNVGLYLIFFAILFVFGVAGGFLRSTTPSGVALFAGYGIYLVGALLLLIQRSHDMNMSGWWSVAAFIPLVGLLWVFVGGTRGANRWGAPPPPNTLAIKIIGLFFPVLVVVGIVAAVALPAYQQYTLRARAAASH